MLQSVYPTFIDGYNIHVKSYLEVLAEKDMEPSHKADAEIVTHDYSVYARCEYVIEQPRKLLSRAWYRVKEPKDSKDLTHCCGGLVESIFHKTANQIGEKRVEQLKNAKAQSAALMCPICLATFKKASGLK